MNSIENIDHLIYISTGQTRLEGSLKIPKTAKELILFAHGSGSSRHSPRNNYVADILRDHGFGTLLIDLLTIDEDRDYEMRFDIDLLAGRLLAATNWLLEQRETKDLYLGYFGASTGAAAAIQAAAELENRIGAIVSRGGRPDLAWPYLDRIKSPTLLIVGGYDEGVTDLNRRAYERINAVKQLEIVPHATHLFEESGALEKVAEMAAAWFGRFLVHNEGHKKFTMTT